VWHRVVTLLRLDGLQSGLYTDLCDAILKVVTVGLVVLVHVAATSAHTSYNTNTEQSDGDFSNHEVLLVAWVGSAGMSTGTVMVAEKQSMGSGAYPAGEFLPLLGVEYLVDLL
jgi:hypothetical protein